MTARYDTEWSSTAGPCVAAAGAALPVVTSAGPWWTTNAESMPLNVTAGDCPLTVSTIAAGFVDTYERTVTGGWGGAWIREGGPSADSAVASGVATHSESDVGGPTRRSLLDLGLTDVDASWTVSIPQVAAGVAAQAGLMVREDGANSNFYIFRVLFFTDGRLETRISVRVDGVETTIGNPAGTQSTYVGGTQVHVRSQAIGPMLAMKVWTGDDVEPSSWQVEVQDATFAGPGRVGLRSGLDAGWTGDVPFVFSYRDFRLNADMQTFTIAAATPEGVTVPAGTAVRVADAP